MDAKDEEAKFNHVISCLIGKWMGKASESFLFHGKMSFEGRKRRQERRLEDVAELSRRQGDQSLRGVSMDLAALPGAQHAQSSARREAAQEIEKRSKRSLLCF